jgi:sigma-B regulation protein RsbU (phosphoserine phosphatase)
MMPLLHSMNSVTLGAGQPSGNASLTITQAITPPRLSQDALARILDVTQKLAQPYDLLHMLTEVVEAGESVLAADKATLWLFNAAKNHLTMKVPSFKPAPRMAAGEGLVGECLSTREIINVTNAYADSRFSKAVDQATGYKTQSVLNVPLLGWEKEPVGVLQLLNKYAGVFDENDELLASTLAAQCAVAVQRMQLTQALLLKERLDEEVALAREIQMSTLPAEMPRLNGYDLHGHFVPTGQTGGDLFDLVVLGDQLFILMGDATGHGFGPALSATQMQAMLRVAFRCGARLGEAYRHVNNQLAEDLPDDRFITAFMGFLDPVTHVIRFHSGGQGPILHFRAADERCEWHRPTTFPLGILEQAEVGKSQELKMDPGDVLVLLSDGIYEYESKQGVQFGEDRVARLLKYHHRLPMVELSKQILNATYEHGEGVSQQDDITLVLLRRLPEEH